MYILWSTAIQSLNGIRLVYYIVIKVIKCWRSLIAKNEFADPDVERPYLLQHQVVWWMEGIFPAMKFDDPETFEWRPNADSKVEMNRNRWTSLYIAVLNNE